MKKFIDCHTHLQTEELIEEYFANRVGYAISIKALDSLIGNGDTFYKATEKYENIFICESIDALEPIKPQIEKIKLNLKKYRTIGLKIYLGYQPIFADDEKLLPVYEFAKENELSVVFHCGVGADNLYYDEKFSSSLPIENVAKQYPTVNFIASHFDYPNFDDCAKIVCNNANIYTDISGEFENFGNSPYHKLINEFVAQIFPTIEKYDKDVLAKKVMFGTDYFGIGSGFDAVEEYMQTCKILFGEKNTNNCLYNNCINAYPKIMKYIKNKDKEL